MEKEGLSTQNLTKDFQSVRALDSLNLQTTPGIFGLIGPNGAGKTTLIKILVGLIKPTSGSAQVLGLDIKRESLEIRRVVGVLPEKPSFPKTMKVIDFVKDVTAIYGSKKSTSDLLEMVDLSYAKNRVIGQLSAGMYQRLGIALAFAGNPQLVFLDEPTANLDIDGRDQILKLITKLHVSLGVSFFISSHILSELERVCNEIAFIKNGRIIEQGAVLDIIEKHTDGLYNFRSSKPQQLLSVIETIEDVVMSRVHGSTSVIVKIESQNNELVIQQILSLARELGISVQGFQKRSSLEDVFRRVM
ncbi:MAG: ABC transporter ATP-binding protein [Candidatus Thorarchaeota archaeon]|jgi:ABC-2 type transport system ATP-binding protein